MTARTPDEIWRDDLFGRRQEAENVISFLESISGRSLKREDKEAYTLSIDANYGEGKSFFLRRLSEHIKINHPVAFVDAWADDLANEPLTALVATLDTALEPFSARQSIKPKIKIFKDKAGKILRIAGAGLLRRGAGLIIGATAVDALEEAISNLDEFAEEAAKDKTPEVGQGLADDIAESLHPSDSTPLMDRKINEFREGQAAIHELKQSLSEIISSLKIEEISPPIFIIIDELDRCRPTYAVKLLEEIKHIFDVPGLVFILALNSDQLQHSISGAYGSGFNGRTYLTRFIDREYHLSTPALHPLIEALCRSHGINQNRYSYENVVLSQRQDLTPNLSELISIYAIQYKISARDIFRFIDILQTCQSIVTQSVLQVSYLFPVIIGHLKGLPSGALPEIENDTSHRFARRKGDGWIELTFAEVAQEYADAGRMSLTELDDAIGKRTASRAMIDIRRTRSWDTDLIPINAVDRYPDLIRSVSRFSNPKIENG